MKGFTAMSKLSVTTIRHKLSDMQLSELMVQYQTDDKLKDRVNMQSLVKSGFSRKTVKENGYEIETVITIDKD